MSLDICAIARHDSLSLPLRLRRLSLVVLQQMLLSRADSENPVSALRSEGIETWAVRIAHGI
jgi:hypothetical protein